MISTLLNHCIYEYCIDVIYEKVCNNFSSELHIPSKIDFIKIKFYNSNLNRIIEVQGTVLYACKEYIELCYFKIWEDPNFDGIYRHEEDFGYNEDYEYVIEMTIKMQDIIYWKYLDNINNYDL